MRGERDCTDILLGLRGSAAAPGVRFYDDSGNSFVPTGGTLANITHIDIWESRRLLENVRVNVMFSINRTADSFVESEPKSAENYRRILSDLLRLIKAMKE